MHLHFSPLFIFFWFAGLVANVALLLVMVYRRRWRQFPVVTMWLGLMIARSIALMVIYLLGSKLLYTVVYLVMGGVDFALQLGIVLEIAHILLRPTGTWVEDARARFFAWGFAGIAVAALLTWWINPPVSSPRQVWQVRGNLFTSMVICELFIVMTLTSTRLGLGWRNHVMAIGQGITAWSTLMVAKSAMESFVGMRSPYYLPLEQVRNVTYIAAVCWMILQLWRDEPERKPISPDLQEYILALHRRVEYDLRRLDARH